MVAWVLGWVDGADRRDGQTFPAPASVRQAWYVEEGGSISGRADFAEALESQGFPAML